jgi:hypothetical protein
MFGEQSYRMVQLNPFSFLILAIVVIIARGFRDHVPFCSQIVAMDPETLSQSYLSHQRD